MKSFKRRQIGGPRQLPVSVSSHITVVVSHLQGGEKLELHNVLQMQMCNVKSSTRAKRSSCFLPYPSS